MGKSWSKKHGKKLVKEKQSSFVTLQYFESALHELEQKMKEIICQVLANEIEYNYFLAKFDPSSSKTTKDPTQLANSKFAEETSKEAVEKHEDTMLIKEKQSLFVTLKGLQSGLNELEQKMELVGEVLSRKNESTNIMAEGKGSFAMFDPSSSETTNDFMQLPNSVYAGPMRAMMLRQNGLWGDNLGEPSGVKFLFDGPPPCSVAESASVAVGHHILTVGVRPPSAMNQNCSHSKKARARKAKKRRSRKKGNKIAKGFGKSSSRLITSPEFFCT